jgi:hypothetical protein
MNETRPAIPSTSWDWYQPNDGHYRNADEAGKQRSVPAPASLVSWEMSIMPTPASIYRSKSVSGLRPMRTLALGTFEMSLYIVPKPWLRTLDIFLESFVATVLQEPYEHQAQAIDHASAEFQAIGPVPVCSHQSRSPKIATRSPLLT